MPGRSTRTLGGGRTVEARRRLQRSWNRGAAASLAAVLEGGINCSTDGVARPRIRRAPLLYRDSAHHPRDRHRPLLAQLFPAAAGPRAAFVLRDDLLRTRRSV